MRVVHAAGEDDVADAVRRLLRDPRDVGPPLRLPLGEPASQRAAAEREGVILGLENEHACFIGTGAEAGRIAGAINSPHLKIVWDPGNAYFAGETPYPAYSIGRAETESNALRTAQMLLRNATESADPRAVAAWIKGPGDDEYRRVSPSARS